MSACCVEVQALQYRLIRQANSCICMQKQMQRCYAVVKYIDRTTLTG